MSSKAFDTTDLKLYGEHINLSNRVEEEGKRNVSSLGHNRPRSALYAPNLNIPENKRRPFSAGNHPNSLSIQPFLKKSQNEKRDSLAKAFDFMNRSMSIPGATDSTILFNKLVRDPIAQSKGPQRLRGNRTVADYPMRHLLNTDNFSDVSSVDTATSFGTKIKHKAQINKILIEDKSIVSLEGNALKVSKGKTRKYADIARDLDIINETKTDARDIASYESKNPMKLSIFMPNNKDENTSSGVSSSSDVQPNREGSPVTSHPGTQKFARVKRNISINWFPESTTKSQSQTFEESSKPKDVKGIVSFGDRSNFENIDDEQEYSPEPSKLYNTELSLVEEESSQESESSIKMSPSIFDQYKDYKRENRLEEKNNIKMHDSEVNSEKNKVIKFSDVIKVHDDESNSSIDNSILRDRYEDRFVTNTYDRSDTFVDRSEIDLEKRFKELEYKYKIDITKRSNTDLEQKKIHDSGDTYNNYGGLKRAWTSLEKIVSKEDDPICLGKANDSKSSNDNINVEDLTEVQNYKSLTVPEIDLSSFNDSISPSTSKLNIDKISKNDIEVNNKDNKVVPDIIIDYANGKNKFENTIDRYASITDKPVVEKEISESRNVSKSTDDIEYPDYLQRNEARQYTSKVIEDYKREIATIDNVHELTLIDIRNENSDKFDIKNYSRSFTPNVDDKYIRKTEECDYSKTSTVIDDNSHEILNKDISKFMSEYKRYKLGDCKASSEINIRKIDSDFEDEEEKIEENISTSNLKSKKKVKKKNVGKHKINSGNESGDSILKKKSKPEIKRFTKSAPCKKDGTNRVRFKPQKITLSRSSTNISGKSLTEKDNDIISWMSTKVSTSDETSSNDVHDTPTPDLIKEKSLEYRTVFHDSPKIVVNNMSEEKIEPIIKDQRHKDINDFISVNNDTMIRNKPNDSVIRKPVSVKEITVKPKEVTFDVDKCTSSSIADDLSINDWIGNDSDGNELTELLDDDNMVSNIYSVLKEIEQTGNSVKSGGGGDSVATESRAIEDGKSAEYRDIFSFLEHVENKANDEISSLSHTQPPFSLKVEELMELSKGELAHRAVAGALAAGRAGAAAARLKAALVKAASRASARIKAERLAGRQKANAAAQQSAQTIARHQKFIEQLINEKKVLAERIEKLVAAVESAEARSARAARASAERLQLDLRNQRQRLAQAHQREKQTWLKQHTQKIKDMTIKGLEAEVDELEEKHKNQVQAMQKEWEDRLAQEKEKHSRDVRLLKEANNRLLEDELDRERLLAAERMEQKRMEWDTALAAASERAGAEGREAARGARREAEQWKKEREKELEERRKQLEAEVDERRNALMIEANQIKEKLTSEFEKFKEEYKKKQNGLLKDKELEIRALTRRERDREIERAIETMEAEAEEGRKEMQESVRRIKAKYENDMKTLEDAEQSALQRCKEARELLRESQELCAQQQINITQLEGRLRQADELRAQTIAEMELAIKSAEMKGKEEVEEMRGQLVNLQLQHKDEMHQLYAKVKVAVSKKDDALTAARRDAATLRDRCLRLEARLVT